MSKTVIYRCDLCGRETLDALHEMITDCAVYYGGVGRREMKHMSGDICIGCKNRINEALDEAWDNVFKDIEGGAR